jgi:phenylalanine-4-hydroxylase
MKQNYNNYTTEDFQVWKILFNRQFENLKTKGSQKYMDCLISMNDVLHAEKIPDFEELNVFLNQSCGWQIEVVKGLIPVTDFFQLLSERKFCSSTWLRNKNQIDYLEEPDMFHDIFGHIPLLLNPQFANFTQQLGELGIQFKDSPGILLGLQRLYWFTIEFGLIKEHNKIKSYGAGIMSSFGETNHIHDDHILIESYEIHEIIAQEFVTDEIQNKYRVIEDFDQLFQSISQLKKMFSIKNRGFKMSS